MLVTGAAGFIGAHVVRALLNGGHEVIAVIRPTTRRWRLWDRSWDRELPLTYISDDLADLTVTTQYLQQHRPDLCIHLAWQGYAARADVAENAQSLRASLDLLRLLLVVGCPRVVVVGSGYDTGTNPYSICKAALADVSFAFGDDLSVVVARPFHCYGPMEQARTLVPTIIQGCLRETPVKISDGAQVRDYLHVEDVASALVQLGLSDVIGRVDVCSGQHIKVMELALYLSHLMNDARIEFGAVSRRPDEPERLTGDPVKLLATGWMPRWPLDEGLAQTVGWWKRQAVFA